jgi:nucleotide sugar dehydrogenase
MIKRTVLEKKTLCATYTYDALKLCDVAIVDVQCDFLKEELGNVTSGHTEMSDLEDAFRVLGRKVDPECLVLIETTVAPGTTEYIAYPLMRKEFERRGISKEPRLAHSFERVMPGKQYVDSVKNFWRVCSGIDPVSSDRVVKFLSEVINVDEFPLTVLSRPIESETCKIVENSYRAAILGFLHEWSIFSERNGVDLIKVLEAIRVRPTHSNILFPGPGIGGYCLPKDGGLGMWSYRHLMGFQDDIFQVTPQVININDTRALHAGQLVRDALRNMGRIVAAAQIAVLGASYREDVGDTRYSGSELIIRKLVEMGGEVKVHDPYVRHWWEFEKQESYPATGQSRARFFRNQKELSQLVIEKDVESALKGADAVVFAVRHSPYLEITPEEIVEMAGKPLAVIDCFGIFNDDQIRRLFELGCEVKGMGRGHITRIKKDVQAAKGGTLSGRHLNI